MGTSYSTQRIKQGKHNFDAYLYLLKEKNDKFLDWAVTTAYYSANHYVKGKIFPHTEKINDEVTTFNEFDGYYNSAFRAKDRSLHKVLIDLAYKEMPKDVAAALKKLHDLSDTARYHDYNLSSHGSKKKIKEDIQKKLDRIQQYCTS